MANPIPSSVEAMRTALAPYQTTAENRSRLSSFREREGGPALSRTYEILGLRPGQMTTPNGRVSYAIAFNEQGYPVDHRKFLGERHQTLCSFENPLLVQYLSIVPIKEAIQATERADTNGRSILTKLKSTPAAEALGPVWYFVGLNPRISTQYREQRDLLDRFLPRYPGLSPEKIIKLLENMNRQIRAHSENRENCGVLRNKALVVYRQSKHPRNSAEHIAAIQNTPGYTEQDLRDFSRLQEELRTGAEISPEGRQLFAKYFGQIPPSPNQVPCLLTAYISVLQEGVSEMQKNPEFDPVALAAYAISEFCKIHPFFDGNGRIGRLLMNAILKMGKFNPVIFASDREYTEAIERDQTREPGYFARYLLDTMEWTYRHVLPHNFEERDPQAAEGSAAASAPTR